MDDTEHVNQSGLIPVLLQKLVEHSKLAQEAADIQTRYQALSHVFQCKTEFSNLDELVKAGKLSEAVTVLETLHTLLQLSPEPVARSKLFEELQVRFSWHHRLHQLNHMELFIAQTPKFTSVSSRTTERCLYSRYRHFCFPVSHSIIGSWYAVVWRFSPLLTFFQSGVRSPYYHYLPSYHLSRSVLWTSIWPFWSATLSPILLTIS